MAEIPLYLVVSPLSPDGPIKLKKMVLRDDLSKPVIDLLEYMLDTDPDELNPNPYDQEQRELVDYSKRRYEVIKSHPSIYNKVELIGVIGDITQLDYMVMYNGTGQRDEPKFRMSIQDYPEIITRIEDNLGIRDEVLIVCLFPHLCG